MLAASLAWTFALWRGGLLDAAGNSYIVLLLGFALAFSSMGVREGARLVQPEPPPAH